VTDGSVAELLGDEAVRALSRRYFVSNGFDGALTAVGVVVGAVLSGVPDGGTVVEIGAGAAVGLATSGLWSVWEIERAEKRAELLRIERAMLSDLEGTRPHRRRRRARAVNAVASGIGPLVGALLPLVPFLFEGEYLTMTEAGVSGVAVASLVLFGFGAYLGALSERRWLVAGLRMALAGLVAAGLTFLLPG
jgi:predicted membrane protein (TIGR00267 family)